MRAISQKIKQEPTRAAAPEQGAAATFYYCFSNRTPDCVRGSRTARYAGGVKA